MTVFNLYSKRQKNLREGAPEIFIYDHLPSPLRVQITLIIQDALGEKNDRYGTTINPDQIFDQINKILCREYGVHDLGYGNGYVLSGKEYVINHILFAKENDRVLDAIELCFKFINRYIGDDLPRYKESVNIVMEPTEAIDELNIRFKEHGVGYQFESNAIIKLDSTFVHSEITKPTLSLLWNLRFEGANDEYLKAHEHYRHGRNKECLTECLKAFESTIKIICSEKGWEFNQTDTASKLIKICFDNNLVPSFTQNQFSSLQNLLVSGIPTIRNKVGGHGQGQVPQIVDDGMTRYGLNLTGTNILFLIEQSGIV
jgi:hypothetical protein